MHASRDLDTLKLAGVLLREPERLIGRDRDDEQTADNLALLAPRLLAITLLGAALFGVVIGSYRGELQYLYAALKTPVLLLLPVLIGLPAIRAFHDACEVEVAWSRLALAALVSVARTSVLAAACAPVLWLYLSWHPDYHRAVLAMAACLALVGIPGLLTLIAALPDGGRQRPLASMASIAVLGILLAQSGWLLRPFVVRPRAEVTLLRSIEADVFSSLASTGSSARGRYLGWEAEGAGLLGRKRAGEPQQAEPQQESQP